VASSRRRVVTAEPKLHIELVSPNSPVVDLINEIDALLCLSAPPVPTVVKLARLQLKSFCVAYLPCKEDDPFYQDGYGVMCGSGRDGNPVLRGKLCAKACKLGSPDDSYDELVLVDEIQPAQISA
jgi:hypothetical protein